MPFVQVEIFEGKSLEQKRMIVREITDSLVRSINCAPEAVSVIIREMKRENQGRGGVLFVDR